MDRRIFRLLWFYLLTLGTIAIGDTVPIPNGGFEAVSGIDPQFFSVNGRLLPGKGLVFSGGSAGTNFLVSAQAVPGWSGPASSGSLFPTNVVGVEGQNAAWIGGAGDLSQILAATWMGGSVYTLQVDWAPLAAQVPVVSIGLYANGQLIAEQTNGGSGTSGRFQTLSVTNSLPKANPSAGFPIEIRISSKLPSAGALVDNVRLSVEVGEDWVPVPSGMIAWWRGENSTSDTLSNASGIKRGNQKFGPGRVGTGFQFDGINSAVSLGNPTSLALTSLSIEGWIKRASSTTPSRVDEGFGAILGTGLNGYALTMLNQGNLTFSQVGVTRIDSTVFIQDTNWHHVAVTVGGGALPKTHLFYRYRIMNGGTGMEDGAGME